MKGESEKSEENKNHPHFLYSEKEITAFTFHLFLSLQRSYVKYIDIFYYYYYYFTERLSSLAYILFVIV